MKLVPFSVLVLHAALQPFNCLATGRAGFGAFVHNLLVLFPLSFAAITFMADRASLLLDGSLVWTAGQLVLAKVTDCFTAVYAEAFLLLMDFPYVVLKILWLLEYLITVCEGACDVWFFLASVLEMFVQSPLFDLLSTFWTRNERLSVPPHVCNKILSLAVEYLVTQ